MYAVHSFRHGIDLISEGFVLHEDRQHYKGVNHHDYRKSQPCGGEYQSCGAGPVHLFPFSAGEDGKQNAQRPQRQRQNNSTGSGYR